MTNNNIEKLMRLKKNNNNLRGSFRKMSIDAMTALIIRRFTAEPARLVYEINTQIHNNYMLDRNLSRCVSYHIVHSLRGTITISYTIIRVENMTADNEVCRTCGDHV